MCLFSNNGHIRATARGHVVADPEFVSVQHYLSLGRPPLCFLPGAVYDRAWQEVLSDKLIRMTKVLGSLLFVFVLLGCGSTDKPASEPAATGDPETRVVDYLNKNVTPGKPVLVTELYNNVFTTPEEQKAVKRLYDALFEMPAFVAKTQMSTGKIPTINEISAHFNFQVPGTTETLLRVLESDPRVPPFFKRDSATGEITSVNADLIRTTERFRDHLK
jgi:hypothetical protein